MKDIIPVHFLPKGGFIAVQERLAKIAKGCTKKETSVTESLMQIAGIGLIAITTDYNADDFGFSPNELAMFPDNTIGLSVGVTHGIDHPQVWFVAEKMLPGVFYWPGANNPEFFLQGGFARIQAGN